MQSMVGIEECSGRADDDTAQLISICRSASDVVSLCIRTHTSITIRPRTGQYNTLVSCLRSCFHARYIPSCAAPASSTTRYPIRPFRVVLLAACLRTVSGRVLWVSAWPSSIRGILLRPFLELCRVIGLSMADGLCRDDLEASQGG